ncbi:MAG: ethanolamine ammonia-lyase light chain EutC [Candidatus Solibacter sp.]
MSVRFISVSYRVPRPSRTDAQRNCILNVRTEGIGYDLAAHKLWTA